MSVGTELQEMENIEENVVTKGAASGDKALPTAGTNAAGVSTPGNSGAVEDLGGPTPENYKSTDDSAKLKTPGQTLKQVKDVVSKGAKSAEKSGDVKPGAKLQNAGDQVELEADQEVVSEEPAKEEEAVVAEEEKSTEEVVAEEETTEAEVVEEKIDVEEDLNALVAGLELSEENQEKARTIFEAAIKAKVAEMKEQVKAEHEENLVEQVASIKEELTERVDSYLEYAADEWIAENQLAVEHGLKTEMTESFLVGMKNLFEEHYVQIPEEKYNVIESMVDKLDEMEAKLNEQIGKNVALNKRLAESVADVILADVAEGLALSQKDKFASLAENVEFESEESYREKLVTLRKSYFPENAGVQRDTSENLSEEKESTEYQTRVAGASMERYLRTLSQVSKK